MRELLAELMRPTFRVFSVVLPAAAVVIAIAMPSPGPANADEAPLRTQLTVGLGTAAARPRVGSGAAQLAPGESVERSVDVKLVRRPGTRMQVTITTLANGSSLLDTDARNGLRVRIDSCPVGGWLRQLGGGFVCRRGASTALAVTAVARAKDRPVKLAGALPGNDAHFRLTFSLPSSADNRLQRLVSQLRFTFSAQ